MTHVSDLIKGGYWPLQHQETKTILGSDLPFGQRTLRFGARVTYVRGRRNIVQEGPISGGLVWDTKDAKAYPNIWSFAAPSAPNGSGQVSLVKGPKWSETVSGVKTMTPAFNNEQQFPAGWSAVTLAAVDFDKQNEVALAGFDGIVAPHFSNVPKLGTPVWELNGRGLGARARFQSLARLYEPPTPTQCLTWGDGNHLALQLGASTDGAGFLVMADDPDKVTTGGLQDLATANKRGGGPFDVGGGTCPHVHGKNARGETMRALHNTTNTLFRGGIGDGPLYFKSKLYDQNVFDAPFKNRVEILWNPERLHTWGCGVANGLWEAQAESFASLIFPPKKPLGEPKPKPAAGGGGGIDGFPEGPVEGDPIPRELFIPPELFGGVNTGDPLPETKEDFPRELFIPPELFGGDRISDLRARPRPIYGTSLEMALPAIVGRAQHFSKKKHDLRSVGKRLSDEQLEFWACQPATMRSEYFASQTEDCFNTTQSKQNGRYQHVPTASGGRVNMPPELGLEYLVDGFDDLTGLSYSTTYDIDWKTRRGRGTPILTGTNAGGLADGFSDYYNETTKRWVTYHHDSTGAATLVREYDAQGRDRKLCIATYGDGSDGDLSSGSTNVSVLKYYDNLTVLSSGSGTIGAKSLCVFVKNTLTMNANTYMNAISEGGADGDEGSAGGVGSPERWYGASGAGGDGGTSGGSGSAGGSTGPSLGGSGGSGGAGTAGAAGSGGTATAPSHFPRFLEGILHGQDRDLSGYEGGAGGGGGGAGGGVDAGGGGSGGGILVIVARHLVLNTSGGALFRAHGGEGGAGFNDGSGGGGGGGGGFVCLIYQTAEDHNGDQLTESDLLELIDVSGGSGGAGQGSGSNGSDGTDGAKIVLKHG